MLLTVVGERAFLCVNDALLDLARAQSVVAPNDADDRNIDRRKNIPLAF